MTKLRLRCICYVKIIRKENLVPKAIHKQHFWRKEMEADCVDSAEKAISVRHLATVDLNQLKLIGLRTLSRRTPLLDFLINTY